MAKKKKKKTSLHIYPRNKFYIPTYTISKSANNAEFCWDVVDFFDKLAEVHFCITDHDEINDEFNAFERNGDEIIFLTYQEAGVTFRPVEDQGLVGIKFILEQDFLDKLYVNREDDKLEYFIKLIYKSGDLPVEVKKQAYILVTE